ncbi:MAG: hypothetical protein U0359_02865 [Byssovorax sp.]
MRAMVMGRVCALSVMAIVAGCAGTETTDEEPLGEAEEAAVTSCPWSSPAMVFEKEQVITDLSVVEDPCRTTWTASGCGSSLAAWTFGKLMSQMAGLRPSSEFVGEWLHTWEGAQSVNGYIAGARPGTRQHLINPWIAASYATYTSLGDSTNAARCAPTAVATPCWTLGCTPTITMSYDSVPITGTGACQLRMDAAPMKLLAIVNRVDMDGDGGAEGRFVFGLDDAATGAMTQFSGTFILEYKLPTTSTAQTWAQDFHALGALSFGSTYNAQLQAITDRFVKPGVTAGNPNAGSALGQLRTNEVAFGAQWEMREFHLCQPGIVANDCLLQPFQTANTPDPSKVGSSALSTWIFANRSAIAAETATMSKPLEGAASAEGTGLGSGSNFTYWQDPTGTLTADGRHLFGLMTCNGCHTAETDTSFTHIQPRQAGKPAKLSPFLATSADPSASQSVSDPAGTGTTFLFNEPYRRVCETRRVLAGSATHYTTRSGAH